MRPEGSPPFVQLRWRQHRCKVCGTGFTSSRIDAEYCGATCRQRDRRIRAKVSQKIAADVSEKPAPGIIRDIAGVSPPLGSVAPAPAVTPSASRKIPGADETGGMEVPSRHESGYAGGLSSVTKPKRGSSSTARSSPARSKPGWKPSPEAVKFVKVMKKVDKLPLKKGAAVLKKVMAKKGGKKR